MQCGAGSLPFSHFLVLWSHVKLKKGNILPSSCSRYSDSHSAQLKEATTEEREEVQVTAKQQISNRCNQMAKFHLCV